MAGSIKFGDTAARLVSQRVGGTCASTTVIEAIPANARVDGMVVADLATQKLWVFDADSTEAASATVLEPDTGSGRWLVVASGSARTLATVAPEDVGTTAAVGDDTAVARQDHVHELADNVVVEAKIASDAVTAAKIAAATISPTKLAVATVLAGTDAVGFGGVPYTIFAALTAGVTGAADDVFITDSLPVKSRLVDLQIVLTTGVDASTATLRSASGGGGTALSNAIATAIANQGSIRWNHTTCPELAAGSDLYLRRSDRAIAGFAILTLVPVA